MDCRKVIYETFFIYYSFSGSEITNIVSVAKHVFEQKTSRLF